MNNQPLINACNAFIKVSSIKDGFLYEVNQDKHITPVLTTSTRIFFPGNECISVQPITMKAGGNSIWFMSIFSAIPL